MRDLLGKYLVGALLLSGAACSEPLAPESVLGTYELASAIAPVETATHRYEVLAIRVELVGVHLARTTVTRTTELASADMDISVSRQEMIYRIDGARIVTSMLPCPLGMACTSALVTTPDYRVLPDGLLELGRDGPTQAFARVPVDERLDQ